MTLPLEEAAAALGMAPGTLRRLIRTGAPVASRGGRGRGRATLVDVEAVRQWLGADSRDALVLELAAAVPGIVARALAEGFTRADGIDKRRLAGITAASWYMVATALNDRLRESNAAVREIESIPPEIQRLQKIARND